MAREVTRCLEAPSLDEPVDDLSRLHVDPLLDDRQRLGAQRSLENVATPDVGLVVAISVVSRASRLVAGFAATPRPLLSTWSLRSAARTSSNRPIA
jgi:hypothetical protein